MKNTFLILVIATAFIGCSDQKTVEIKSSHANSYKVSKDEAKLWLKSNQLFKPLYGVKIDSTEENLAKLRLGKLLYYDTRLSKNNNISCNSCHNLKNFGVDNEPTSPGTDGKRGGRNSQTSLNAYLHFVQFWDGRAKDVEAQAQGPILNPVEMGIAHKGMAIEKIAAVPGYRELYKKAYPNDKITYENLTASIGFFERTLATPSKFDKFLANDFEALTVEEKEGLKLYIETGCQTCHMGVAMGGSMYEKFGKYDDYWKYTGSAKIDNGMVDLTKKDSDKYRFKVPSLRNVTKTYPYFHDGSVKDLKRSVIIMAKIQLNKELSDLEASKIVTFLETLTGEVPKDAARFEKI
ncbi:MAG: cytochrome-c peroxidase [Cytophagales bacterium]